MIKITQITTIDELWKNGGAPTGNLFVDGFVEFLKNYPSHKPSDAAALMEINERLLREAILVFLGIKPIEAIIRWRVMQAIEMMNNPELTISEIAHRCGFGSERSLERYMKEYYGTTIGTYRTGIVVRNGSYPFNQSVAGRREVMENAKRLREEQSK